MLASVQNTVDSYLCLLVILHAVGHNPVLGQEAPYPLHWTREAQVAGALRDVVPWVWVGRGRGEGVGPAFAAVSKQKLEIRN